MNRPSFRSPLGRAIGLGSSKSGSQHWMAERVTAVALVPLTLWFVATIVAHAGSDHTAFIAWLRTPFAAGGMILLLVALFHHTALGLQVVIEDYVHSDARFAAVIAIQLCCYGLALVGIIATLRITLGG
jgi:succinate dehydrogenase / fumarate reductase membrane anchor subunit